MSRRILALILSVVMLFGIIPANVLAVENIAEEAELSYQVKIVSFAENEKENLRSSELLEARLYVSDDGGNTWEATDKYKGTSITQLQYTWTNQVGTYLYVYNSHNMYYINNTDGEEEIGEGKSFTGTGFAWASIYGANISDSDLVGTISVTVKDEKGNVIGTDTHEGKRTQTGGSYFRPVYEYSGIVMDSLEADINAIAFGIFEGEEKTVIDMLGEAGIVHITCTASTVSKASINNQQYISVSGTNPYKVTAENPGAATTGGDAAISITISKQNCKFHQYSSATGTVPVYVYKKPKTTTTATTLTLTNLDERCTYYLGGVEGRYVKVGDNDDTSDDYVIFEGLTPNTEYEVMAKGETDDTNPVYAYVRDKTKPSFTGTIRVLLHTYENPTGVLTDIEAIYPSGRLVFRLKDDQANIATEKVGTGVYLASLSQGVFFPWYTLDGNQYIQSNQQLVVVDKNVESAIHFYTVSYDLNGGKGQIDGSTHISGEKVSLSTQVPKKDGYIFAGWKDDNGTLYESGAVLSEHIEKAYRLTAQWEDAADIYINVTINHGKYDDNGYDQTELKDDITLDLVYSPEVGVPYLETGDRITITNENHPKHEYTWEPSDVNDKSLITTTKYTYIEGVATVANMPANYQYTVVTSKTSYDVETITARKTEENDWVIDVVLNYSPQNKELNFEVNVEEDVPDELVPQAAIVKILFWSSDRSKWEVITQHEDKDGVLRPGVRVDVDFATRRGEGSYPVWVYENENEPYGYRIIVTSLVYPDGKIVPVSGDVLENLTQNNTDIYTINFGDVTDGKPYGQLNGAYFDQSGQQGTLDAVISAQGYNVVFDAQGGAVNGLDKQTVPDQYKVPAFENFVPVRDGGYVFEGWYKEPSCTTPAVEGEYLKSDVTLYAKWKEPLTIQGTVTVSGVYLIDGKYHKIHEVDRIKSVIVALQKIVNDSVITVDSKTVTIDYENDYTGSVDVGIGQYRFDGVEDDGNVFRISVLSSNYECLYRNEPDTDVYSYIQSNYNDYDYRAELNGDKIAVVDAYLVFEPHSFPLNYKIDATAIGEGYRPSMVEMLVLYDDGLKGANPLYWAVISQMVYGSEFYGQENKLTNGIGANSYLVWISKPDGISYYDYAIRLNHYVDFGGINKLFSDMEDPFYVTYNGSAHYDEQKGQSNLLTAVLTPKEYRVIFDLAFEESDEDNIGDSMQAYLLANGQYVTTHTWSFNTEITAQPVRKGYAFLGWYIDVNKNNQKDADELYVTQIDAAVCENDITLRADWKRLADVYVNIIINHIGENNSGHNNDIASKHNISFTVDCRPIGSSSDFMEIGQKTILWNGSDEFCVDGYDGYVLNVEGDKTVYKATAPTFVGVPYGMEYTFTTVKSGYKVESLQRVTDSEGNVTLNVELIYDPNNFDFSFSVRLDEEAKKLPNDVKPVAVNVKVTSWFDHPDYPGNEFGWYTITQMKDVYERILLDENGEGSGSYPVWMTTDGAKPYDYRIEIVSFELKDGTIISVNDLSDNQPSVTDKYESEGGIYSAVINADEYCVDPDPGDLNALKGAYYQNGVQVGAIEAVISIKTFAVTIDPDGGVFSDGAEDSKTLSNLIQMPDILSYTPTRIGYKFAGWKWTETNSGNSTKERSTGELLTENITLTALWEKENYRITYIVNGGKLPEGVDNPRLYDVETAIQHPVPQRDGYVFLGWYDNSSFDGDSTEGFDAGETGDKVFYAKWEYDLTSLIIDKTYAPGVVVDTNQVFIFRIQCEERGIDLYVHIKGAGSVTVTNLPRGIYTVTEETAWSWRYTPDAESKRVDMSESSKRVSFENRGSEKIDMWLSSFDEKSNRFKKSEDGES